MREIASFPELDGPQAASFVAAGTKLTLNAVKVVSFPLKEVGFGWLLTGWTVC
jgi:hypothetical protein